MYRIKKQKGSILVFALVVLSFILIAAFSVAGVTLIERRSADISVNSTTAFQNADKGMEEFLQQLYQDLDQSDSLTDMASALSTIYADEVYKCEDSTNNNVAATIGNTNTRFIISAYEEGVPGPTGSGWTTTKPITDCEEQLANVSRFKVAGNYSNAVRAVFVKLRDSLTRGLLAHWSFEDRAQVARLASDPEDGISQIAQDSSKNAQVLTLCQLESSLNDIVDESGDTIGKIKTFTGCTDNSADFMIPQKKGSDDGEDPNGAWVDGIVYAEVDVDAPVGSDAKEALYFGGNDYLAMWVKNDCDREPPADNEFNCVDKTKKEDKLNPTEGIAISLWIKLDGLNPSKTILSRFASNNKGYQLNFDATNHICFKLDSQTVCSPGNSYDDGKWHHVVGRWHKPSSGTSKFELIVDDEIKDGGNLSAISVSNQVFYIGATDNTTGFFKGSIDDVRIWDRAITDEEITRLCESAQESNADPTEVTCY